jgi:hypothetical protein
VTKAPDVDCAAVEIEDKGTHGFRRFFITYARADGASPDVLESITHNRRGEIIDVYTSFEWPTLCRAVRCLNVNLDCGRLLDFRPSANRALDTFLDTQVDPGRKLNDSRLKMVEAVGIENCGFGCESGKYGESQETGSRGTGIKTRGKALSGNRFAKWQNRSRDDAGKGGRGRRAHRRDPGRPGTQGSFQLEACGIA